MSKSLKDNSFKEFYDFFAEEPDIDEKAWGIIHDFYHLILTTMENNGITKADLARRLNKSRAAISRMFNKNPNVSVKKMVEIADAVDLDISLVSTTHKETTTENVFLKSSAIVNKTNTVEHLRNIRDDFKIKFPVSDQESPVFLIIEQNDKESIVYAEA